jgi:putative YphP/YqiW family bacilliredoxin
MKISLDSLIGSQGPSYPESVVAPYRKELNDTGFESLFDAAAIDRVLDRNDYKIILLVLNSVCGCSARVSRPAVILSLFNTVIPDERYTVFAGMEKDAVAHLRNKYLEGITPSSPNIYLFKNGKLLSMIHRYQIEGSHAGAIADDLIQVYNEHCMVVNNKEKIETLRTTFISLYQIDPLSHEAQNNT